MLNTETSQLIVQLLNQEYRKAKFLPMYQKEIEEAKRDFIEHLKAIGPNKR